jgi:hypothetical protein
MIVRASQNAEELDAAYRHGYPRPQLVRQDWWSLNGEWDFAIDADADWRLPQQVQWKTRINVPFAPETQARSANSEHAAASQQSTLAAAFRRGRLSRGCLGQ